MHIHPQRYALHILIHNHLKINYFKYIPAHQYSFTYWYKKPFFLIPNHQPFWVPEKR